MGSLYLVNLILAIVALSYQEQQVIAQEEAKQEERVEMVYMKCPHLALSSYKLIIDNYSKEKEKMIKEKKN